MFLDRGTNFVPVQQNIYFYIEWNDFNKIVAQLKKFMFMQQSFFRIDSFVHFPL